MKTYEDLIEFCNNNINEMRFSNSSDNFALDTCINYLLNIKFKKWNYQEIIFIISYLTYQFMQKYNFTDFSVNFGESQEDLNQKSILKDVQGAHTSLYSYKDKKVSHEFNYGFRVFKNIMSSENCILFNGIHTIYHELAHAYQQELIRRDERFIDYTFEQYLLAIEDNYIQDLINHNKKGYQEFIEKYYSTLYSELDAEKRAIEYSIEFFELHKPKFLLEEDVRDYVYKLKNNYIGKGKLLEPNKSNILYENNLIEKMLLENKILLKYYPILSVAFDDTGLKKSKEKLLDEKAKKIQINKNNEKEINVLYDSIININRLDEYI